MSVQIERRLAESGRIRTGKKNASGFPEKLTTFRLTSRDRTSLQEAAAIYGGNVVPWREGEFELITKTNEMAVLIPPDSYSQWYEQWGGGTCKRRCNGNQDDEFACSVPNGDEKIQVPCACDPKKRTCKLVTRANFLLPDLPNLGLWRLDTGSTYAAMELPGALDLLDASRTRNRPVEAVLALEIRKKVKTQSDNKGGTKSVTNTFPVCVLRIRYTYRAMLLQSAPTASQQAPQLAQAAEAMPMLSSAPEPVGEAMEVEFRDKLL